MGCDFCDNEQNGYFGMNGRPEQGDDGWVLVVVTSEWDYYNDGYVEEKIPIRFCPMCGRKLEV